jgi:ribose 5-phosphate isomerase B
MAGFELKKAVMAYLNEKQIPFTDFGAFDASPCDYPVYAKAVCRAILTGGADRGILICGTGNGIAMAANRHAGIRAALCHDTFTAKAAREHNDANVLALGARVIAHWISSGFF